MAESTVVRYMDAIWVTKIAVSSCSSLIASVPFPCTDKHILHHSGDFPNKEMQPPKLMMCSEQTLFCHCTLSGFTALLLVQAVATLPDAARTACRVLKGQRSLCADA